MNQRHPHRRAALAAALSFIFPGLGQAYIGRRRLALLLAVPVVLLVVGTAVVLLTRGQRDLANLLLSSTFLTTLLVLNLALMAWRLLGIAQAGLPEPPPPEAPAPAMVSAVVRSRRLLPSSRAGRIAFVAGLLLITVVMHAWAGLVIGRLDATLDEVFSGGGMIPGPGRPPLTSGAPNPDDPLNEPEYSWDGTERINFLLLGVDSGPGREEALTDTILVLSVDPVAETAVLISVPRDTGYVPLPDDSVYANRLYPRKINQLATDARENPEAWCPDLPAEADVGCGIRTLQRSVGLYVGVPIHHYAQVDLQGFADLIDSVGGLELCLDGRLVDPEYQAPGRIRRGIELPAGCHHYDGDDALAYARIRKGWMELPDGTRVTQNDFLRAERQQRVLLELRREFAQGDTVLELPGMLEAIGNTVSTDFPRDQVGDLSTLVPLITGPDIDRVVLGLPEYVDPPVDPLVNYLLIPKRDAIRAEMERLFGADELEGWYLAGEDAA